MLVRTYHLCAETVRRFEPNVYLTEENINTMMLSGIENGSISSSYHYYYYSEVENGSLWISIIIMMSGNIQSQSSQPAEPLWTDPGMESGISVRELISTSKKKRKKGQAGNEWLNSLPNILASEEEKKNTLFGETENGSLH